MQIALQLIIVLCIVRNYSVSMMLAVQPTWEFVSIPHNVTYLTGIIAGSEIGLHGNPLSVVSVSDRTVWMAFDSFLTF